MGETYEEWRARKELERKRFKASDKLRRAVKTDIRPAYEIAAKAGLHQATLSQILNGIVTVKAKDYRVIAIGEVVGVSSEECFE